MRILLSTLLFLFIPLMFLSCKDEHANDGTPVKSVSARDSAAIIKPEAAVNPYAQVDLSPMDISYYPADYPKIKMSNPAAPPPAARIVYSRPQLQGRQLFPGILKYNVPWRLGANEATELELYSDATILGKKIKAGRYILYCTPQPDTWTIILNSNIDSWGLNPDPAKDIAHFIIPSTKVSQRIEFFTLVFQKTGSDVDLLMAWDNVEARLPISF